jgi:hypothetical protein
MDRYESAFRAISANRLLLPKSANLQTPTLSTSMLADFMSLCTTP